ncbi:MAG: DUF2970 domain-containing protein [Stenotrophobium sp.]
MSRDPCEEPTKSPTVLQTVSSVGAAIFGVQSSKNRKRDFSSGKPLHFIVTGIVMTLLLVCAIIFAVKFALHHAGV